MADDEVFYPGFRERWQDAVDGLAAETGLRSVLVMRSTPPPTPSGRATRTW